MTEFQKPPPLDIKCTSTDCDNDLHCFKQLKKMTPDQRGKCRACGAGHIVAILGRAVDEHRIQAVALFGEQVIPILRRAEIA